MLKYQAIAADLREKITRGIYQPDDQLPPSGELERTYQASKMTVKHALDYLENAGLIVKRRGSGTFVKGLDTTDLDRLVQRSRSQLLGMSSVYAGRAVKSKVLTFEAIAAPEAARAQLRLEVGSFVYHIVRVRYLDGKPLILEKSYMPVVLLPNLRQQHAEQSIFSFVRDELHLRIQSVHHIVRVRGADAIEAAELRLASGAPVAVVQETYFLASGVPFNYSIATHEPEHFALETVLVD